MANPAFGTALIECANPPCDWRGTEREMIPDPAPKVAPRGRLTAIENVCPKCKRPGYYFAED